MSKQVTVLIRHPDHIRQGVEAGRKLCERGDRPRVVFLCPGCSSRLACRSAALTPSDADLGCFTDRSENCAPTGFRRMGADHIARMIRRSDIVVPL
jgi:hypothetical protein